MVIQADRQARCVPYGTEELAYLKRRDKQLAPIIDAIEARGHIQRPMDDDLFCSVVHHIVGQQISTAAQKTIWTRMQERWGVIDADRLSAAAPEDIQSCGLTFRKVSYIQDFATRVSSGAFDLEAVAHMPDDEAIAALSGLKGIGTWTAEMILLFCLGRPDVLSYGDLAIQRGMRMVYRHRAITPQLFAKYHRRLSPYGSTASLFFWEVSHGVIEGLTDPAPKKKAGNLDD